MPPAIILIHGAWHTPKIWDRLVPLLTAHGYEIITPQLPSSGGDPPVADFEPDIHLIRRNVLQLLEKNTDVIVLAHSYAGMPMGTALDSLDSKSRKEAREGSGVVKLIYLNGFLVPEGYQHSPNGVLPEMGPVFKVDGEKGVVTCDHEGAKKVFYNDIDDDTAEQLAQDLKPQSLGPFWGKTTSAAWRTIPTTYIMCTNSHGVELFRGMIDVAKSTGEHKIEKVIELDSSHTPMFSMPEKLAEILRSEAGENI